MNATADANEAYHSLNFEDTGSMSHSILNATTDAGVSRQGKHSLNPEETASKSHSKLSTTASASETRQASIA